MRRRRGEQVPQGRGSPVRGSARKVVARLKRKPAVPKQTRRSNQSQREKKMMQIARENAFYKRAQTDRKRMIIQKARKCSSTWKKYFSNKDRALDYFA